MRTSRIAHTAIELTHNLQRELNPTATAQGHQRSRMPGKLWSAVASSTDRIEGDVQLPSRELPRY